MRSFDFAAWSTPIASSDLAAFSAASKSAGLDPEPPVGPGEPGAKSAVQIGVAVLVVVLVAMGFGWLYFVRGGGALAVVEISILGAFAIFALAYTLSKVPRLAGRWPNFYRATQFSEQNGLDFVVQRDAPAFDGLLFTIPAIESARLYNYSVKSSPAFEAGQFRLSTSGANGRKVTKSWGYIAAELTDTAPTRAVVRSGSPASEKVMPLTLAEATGPAAKIDELFTLYCPEETRTLAAALFTPELIRRLHDLESKYGPINAELVDNHVFVYSPKGFNMYDPTTIRLVFDTITEIRA